MNPLAEAPRALITGASGFIGSHLIERLSFEGWQVAAIARPASAPSLALLQPVAKVYRYTGQIAEVVEAVAEFKPQVVFHLGSLFLAQHDSFQIESLISSNILFGTQLLEAMRLAKITTLVNAGTAWQSFNSGGYNPVNLYAATKQAFEDILLYYVETAGVRAMTLRIFDTYGPADTRRKLLALLVDTLRTGEPLGMSPGEQVVDLTHVDDICSAFLHAARLLQSKDESRHEVYAVSSEERHTVREVAAIFEEVAKKPLPITFGARAYRDREVMEPWQGTRLPGWHAKISLREGLRRLLLAEKTLPQRS
jgi:nucleoside-diphosphate-sugar epimerase